MKQTSPVIINIFRWIVRICSVLIITFHVLSFIGDQTFGNLTALDKIKLLLWCIVLFGMVIAWIYEMFGAIVIIGASVIQLIVSPLLMTSWFFWIVYFVAILFLFSGIDKRKRKVAMTG